MNITFQYAFIVGVITSTVVFVGCVLGKRSLVLAGMIFSAIVASPVTTFTRGTAGAVYASDMVSLVLLICWVLPGTKSFICSVTPRWYKWFFRMMMLAFASIVLVAPLFSGGIGETGLAAHVTTTIGGIPLPILMAGFRFVRTILYLAYFIYAAHMIMDEQTQRLVFKLMAAAAVILAVCQIITFLGIADLGLFVREQEWQRGHILGHAKAAAGRLYLVGIFVTLILLYRLWSAPVYLVVLGTIGMGLLISGSRAAFIGMAMGLVVLAVRAKFLGKVLVLLVVALVPLGFYTLARIDPERIIVGEFMLLKDPASNPRWVIWQWIIPYIATHPSIWIFGVGFSNIRYALVTEYIGATREHAHNDFLNCLTEMGGLGLILFSSYVVSLGRGIFGRMKRVMGELRWQAACLAAVFMAYLVTGLFESTLYFSAGMMPTQRILAVLFGTSMGLWVQQDYEADKMGQTDHELLCEDCTYEGVYA